MPHSRAELAIQKVATDFLTNVLDLSKKANKTPQEFLKDNPIYLGQLMMLSKIFLTDVYDMQLDIPGHLVDQLL